MMENKTLNQILRYVRIALPLLAIVLGAIPGSYTKIRLDPASTAEAPKYLTTPTNYFDLTAQTLIDWVPLICMLLCIAALVVAIVCAVKETENNLTLLANMFCFAMVADAAIVIFTGTPTVLTWIIGGVLIAGLVITSMQEMKMEDANKK